MFVRIVLLSLLTMALPGCGLEDMKNVFNITTEAVATNGDNTAISDSSSESSSESNAETNHDSAPGTGIQPVTLPECDAVDTEVTPRCGENRISNRSFRSHERKELFGGYNVTVYRDRYETVEGVRRQHFVNLKTFQAETGKVAEINGYISDAQEVVLDYFQITALNASRREVVFYCQKDQACVSEKGILLDEEISKEAMQNAQSALGRFLTSKEEFRELFNEDTYIRKDVPSSFKTVNVQTNLVWTTAYAKTNSTAQLVVEMEVTAVDGDAYIPLTTLRGEEALAGLGFEIRDEDGELADGTVTSWVTYNNGDSDGQSLKIAEGTTATVTLTVNFETGERGQFSLEVVSLGFTETNETEFLRFQNLNFTTEAVELNFKG